MEKNAAHKNVIYRKSISRHIKCFMFITVKIANQ